MDLVQKEHERLSKRLKANQGIKNVQSTIDLLQSARDAIAAGMSFGFVRPTTSLDSWLIQCAFLDPSQASITLAKLQNPVKSSFDTINDSLKETHSGLNKYSKSLDKVAGPLLGIARFGSRLTAHSFSKTDPSQAPNTMCYHLTRISSTEPSPCTFYGKVNFPSPPRSSPK